MSTATSVSPSFSTRRRLPLFLVILFVAGVWRYALAKEMPALARDGVGYCWNARDLGYRGHAALRDPEFNQHPLYALAILGTQRLLRRAGLPEAPLTWQLAGQAVSWISGLAVVVLAGVLTRRVVQRAEPNGPVDVRYAGLWAMALAALLPLNTWLSADVMSEQLFLAWYLGGVCLLLTLDTPRVALATGVLTGLAFLTRPEGAVVGLGAAAVLLGRVRREPLKKVIGLAGLTLAGFLALAVPYWALLGKFSPKVHKETVEDFRAAFFLPPPLERTEVKGFWTAETLTPSLSLRERVAEPSGTAFARLLRHDTPWYEGVLQALYQTTRGGRVVIPLLALPGLVIWRRRLFGPELRGLTICLAGHFALTAALPVRAGYLDPRHTLVTVMLLVPFAAAFLAYLTTESMRRPKGWILLAVPVVCFAVLAFYAMRVPQGADTAVRGAADWLRRETLGQNLVLMGGSSERRLAFYADLGWRSWPEDAEPFERRWKNLRMHVLDQPPRPDYFAIATGPGKEIAGNDELLNRLKYDERIGPAIRAIHVERTPRGEAVHVLKFGWPPE